MWLRGGVPGARMATPSLPPIGMPASLSPRSILGGDSPKPISSPSPPHPGRDGRTGMELILDETPQQKRTAGNVVPLPLMRKAITSVTGTLAQPALSNMGALGAVALATVRMKRSLQGPLLKTVSYVLEEDDTLVPSPRYPSPPLPFSHSSARVPRPFWPHVIWPISPLRSQAPHWNTPVEPATSTLLARAHADRQPCGLRKRQCEEDAPLSPRDLSMPPEKVASMRKVFDLIDTSGDGLIQPSEIGAVLRRLNLVSSRKMIHTIIDIVDIDGDGEIDFPEYAPRPTQHSNLDPSCRMIV